MERYNIWLSNNTNNISLFTFDNYSGIVSGIEQEKDHIYLQQSYNCRGVFDDM
jgi:hypothetical protein